MPISSKIKRTTKNKRMRYLVIVLIVISFASCERNYECVCTTVKGRQDTVVDHIKTTRLGSKGYKKTCANNENKYLTECRLQ